MRGGRASTLTDIGQNSGLLCHAHRTGAGDRHNIINLFCLHGVMSLPTSLTLSLFLPTLSFMTLLSLSFSLFFCRIEVAAFATVVIIIIIKTLIIIIKITT